MVLLGLCCCVQAFSSCDEGATLHWGAQASCWAGFSYGAQAQWLWCTGVGVLWPVESSWSRDRICFPSTGWQVPIHCTTRKVLLFLNLKNLKKHYLLFCRAVIAQYMAAMNRLMVIPSLRTPLPDNGVHGKAHNLMNISPSLYFIYSEWISWSEAMLVEYYDGKEGIFYVCEWWLWQKHSAKARQTHMQYKLYSSENKMLSLPWLDTSYLIKHLIYLWFTK